MPRRLRPADFAGDAPEMAMALIGAVLLGWLLIGTVPTAYTWAGAALIGGSGLYTVWRERRLHKEEIVPRHPLA